MRALRRYHETPEEEHTEIFRDVAACFVALREQYIDTEGAPDWSGRSYAYRQKVGQILDDARVPKDERQRVRAAIAYHVGNVLRTVLSAEELDNLGLRPLSPRDRSAEKREKHSAIMNVFRTGPAISTPAEALHALITARALLSRVPSDALAGGEDDEVLGVREVLAEIELEAERLGSAMRARGRRKE